MRPAARARSVVRINGNSRRSSSARIAAASPSVSPASRSESNGSPFNGKEK